MNFVAYPEDIYLLSFGAFTVYIIRPSELQSQIHDTEDRTVYWTNIIT
jgi:hypothetical protein